MSVMLDGAFVFLGCCGVDLHIPEERVQRSAEVLRGLGAAVEMRLYPGLGHLVNDDEIEQVQAFMDLVLAG